MLCVPRCSNNSGNIEDMKHRENQEPARAEFFGLGFSGKVKITQTTMGSALAVPSKVYRLKNVQMKSVACMLGAQP